MNIHNVFRNFLLIAFMLSGSTVLALAEDSWAKSIEEGVSKAQEEKKLVMVYFSGSDWSPYCKIINKKVFSNKEFLDAAQKQFVLVKLDAPKKDSKLEKATKKLMKKYKVNRVPYIVLFDEDGKEFNRFDGSAFKTIKLFLKKLKSEVRRKSMF